MILTEIMVLLVLTCVVVFFWLKSNFNYWRQNGIPYIKPTPFLGNTKVIFTLQNSFGLHLSEMYNDKSVANEPVVGIYTLHSPALIIRDPDILKSVLIKDFNKFSNRYGACDPHGDSLGSNNLFFVKNPQWKAIRTKLTPVFTSGKIKQMYPLMQEIGAELETYLASQEKSDNSFVTEVKEVCALFTTDLIATTAFGIRVNSLKDPNVEFRKQGRKLFDFTLKRGLEFSVAFFMPKLVTLFRVKLFPKSFSKFLRETINYVMSERERSGSIRNDLIDILVNLKKEAELEQDPKYFAKNNDFLVAQAALFLTAGFETSSSTMSFALYELAKQPALQERLRQEINEALVEGGGELSYDKIHAMEYLGMVVDEVLRLYPVLPFLDRQCNIPKGETGFSLKPHFNYEVPEGMAVYIPIFGIQRDPKYWPNPNHFDPERFSHENKQHHNPMAYLPFGTGPHNCIGSRIGLLQAKIGLASILKNHYVTTCDRTVKEMMFDPKALLLQCQDGIYLKVVNDSLYESSQKS